jgi:hypothetical protein
MAAPIYPAKVTLCAPGPSGEALTGYRSTVSITRPSNTTQYTAGDVIGIADSGTPANAGSAIHAFTNIGPTGGHILITGADLEIDVNAVPSGMTSFRLYLYDESPTAILDNAVWDFPSGDRSKLLGYIDLGTPVDLGATLFVQTDRSSHQGQWKLKDGSTTLYGELVTNGTFTPASGTVKVIRLRSVAL